MSGTDKHWLFCKPLHVRYFYCDSHFSNLRIEIIVYRRMFYYLYLLLWYYDLLLYSKWRGNVRLEIFRKTHHYDISFLSNSILFIDSDTAQLFKLDRWFIYYVIFPCFGLFLSPGTVQVKITLLNEV